MVWLSEAREGNGKPALCLKLPASSLLQMNVLANDDMDR